MTPQPAEVLQVLILYYLLLGFFVRNNLNSENSRFVVSELVVGSSEQDSINYGIGRETIYDIKSCWKTKTWQSSCNVAIGNESFNILLCRFTD